MTEYPVSKVCPSCGGTSFKRAPVKAAVAFASDRICKACGTRYTPPTPRWVGAAFVFAGLPPAAIGLVLLLFAFFEPSSPGKGVEIFNLLMGLLFAPAGIIAIVHGVRLMMKVTKT